MRKAVLALVVLYCESWLGSAAALAQVETVDQRIQRLCPPQLAPEDKALKYTVDLATGAARDKKRYRTSDEVEIRIINKNPFLFDYRVKVEEQAIPEPALDTFFKVFNTSASAALLATITPPATTQGNPSRPPDCDDFIERSEVFKKTKANLDDMQALLLKNYNELKSTAADSEKLLEALRGVIKDKEKPMQDAAADCIALVTAASAVEGVIEEGFNESKPGFGKAHKELSTKFTEFKKGVNDYETLIAAARIMLKNATCGPAVIESQVWVFETTKEAFKLSLDPKNEKGLQKLMTNFETAAKEIKDRQETIQGVLKRPALFWEAHQVGDYDEITLVTLTIDKKKRDDKDFPPTPFLVKKLRFGGRQRFALAAGASFTGLDLETYKPIQGVPLNADGTPVQNGMVTRVVGLDESSKDRILPLIMLHTRIGGGWGEISGFHLSFGFAGETGNNGLNLEYLLGPSISFAEERFFITAGVYSGRTETLQNGFFVGKPLDATIPDVPVSRGRSRAFGLAATYRFR